MLSVSDFDLSSVGLAVVTYNRQDFCEKVLDSVAQFALPRSVVVVNDGTPYDAKTYSALSKRQEFCIIDKTNGGVATAKNVALKYLLSTGVDHLFVMEDDILITDGNVFREYVELGKTSGISHFNFGFHGPANKAAGKVAPRAGIKYPNGKTVILNRHCVGAFSYYTRECIETVGLMDEKFKNAWEHVEHTYRIIKAGMHPPFWWFCDSARSSEMLKEIACSEENSVIRPRSDWRPNIIEGMKHFQSLHGIRPMEIPDTDRASVVEFMTRRMKR